jgi:hypothetical protein
MRLYTIINVAIRDNEGEKVVEKLLKAIGRWSKGLKIFVSPVRFLP